MLVRIDCTTKLWDFGSFSLLSLLQLRALACTPAAATATTPATTVPATPTASPPAELPPAAWPQPRAPHCHLRGNRVIAPAESAASPPPRRSRVVAPAESAAPSSPPPRCPPRRRPCRVRRAVISPTQESAPPSSPPRRVRRAVNPSSPPRRRQPRRHLHNAGDPSPEAKTQQRPWEIGCISDAIQFMLGTELIPSTVNGAGSFGFGQSRGAGASVPLVCACSDSAPRLLCKTALHICLQPTVTCSQPPYMTHQHLVHPSHVTFHCGGLTIGSSVVHGAFSSIERKHDFTGIDPHGWLCTDFTAISSSIDVSSRSSSCSDGLFDGEEHPAPFLERQRGQYCLEHWCCTGESSGRSLSSRILSLRLLGGIMPLP